VPTLTKAVLERANVVFIDPDEYVSSYELIQASHFVAVYNSTIGLEATLLGKAVLTAGKARYTQISTTNLPRSKEEYTDMFKEFLYMEHPPVKPEFLINARRFLYTQLFLVSLPFDRYLQEDGVWKGYVTLKDVAATDLLPENSELVQILSNGILDGHPFQRAVG
jgi:hypothetical protein